jgi:hypothetical protein
VGKVTWGTRSGGELASWHVGKGRYKDTRTADQIEGTR